MSRISGFSSPLLLGFDHFEQMLDRIAKNSGEGYPPYNIEQIGEQGIRITLAVAGFDERDLNVTVESNQLMIRGRHSQDDGDRVFLHRGIAARQFQRAFVLAEGIEVRGAQLTNGLLHIDLERPIPESRVKSVPIVNMDQQRKAGKQPDAIDLRPSDPALGVRAPNDVSPGD